MFVLALLAPGCGAIIGIGELDVDRGAADASVTDGGPGTEDGAAPADGAVPGAEGGADGGVEFGDQTPSCLGGGPGRSTCGWTHRESCCTSNPVPGGTFFRDFDRVKNLDAGFPAHVSSFRLDRFEVTVGRFRPFADAVVGGWRPRTGSGIHAHLQGGLGL